MKIYISGPMTGIPQFNFPLFAKVAADLRAQGHEVISPAEEDPPEAQAAALASTDGELHDGQLAGHTWGDMLARDVKLIADHGIDCIYLLPGWERSKGAKLEAFVGILCGLHFRAHELVTGQIYLDVDNVSRDWVALRLHMDIIEQAA